MIQKQQLILSGFITAMSATSPAQAEGWYFSANAGYSNPTSKMFNDGTNGAGNPKTEFDSGVPFGLGIGYQLTPSLKVEAKYTSVKYDTDTGLKQGTDTRALDQFGLDGSVDSDIISLNAAYEFNNASKFTPYIKAGIGANFFDAKGDLYVTSSGGNTFDGALPATFSYSGDGRSTAYFLGFGVSSALTNNMDFTAEYLYGDLGEVATDYDENGDRLQSDLKVNTLMLGIEYSF